MGLLAWDVGCSLFGDQPQCMPRVTASCSAARGVNLQTLFSVVSFCWEHGMIFVCVWFHLCGSSIAPMPLLSGVGDMLHCCACGCLESLCFPVPCPALPKQNTPWFVAVIFSQQPHFCAEKPSTTGVVCWFIGVSLANVHVQAVHGHGYSCTCRWMFMACTVGVWVHVSALNCIPGTCVP